MDALNGSREGAKTRKKQENGMRKISFIFAPSRLRAFA
jgi:hypothetical protein